MLLSSLYDEGEKKGKVIQGVYTFLVGLLNVFLFQKDSPSKPSVAELAGRFKGHILPMPASNDEVAYFISIL